MSVARDEDALSLTFMRLGETRVAFPTARIAHVDDATEASSVDAADPLLTIDLGLHLGVTSCASRELGVLLSFTEVDAGFLVTRPVSVLEVTADAVQPVPTYLATWARRRGIVGVVIAHEQLGYLLDVDLLVDRHREAKA